METYTQAYNRYLEKCETFGIDGIDFIEFIHRLTVEQVQMMVSDFR